MLRSRGCGHGCGSIPARASARRCWPACRPRGVAAPSYWPRLRLDIVPIPQHLASMREVAKRPRTDTRLSDEAAHHFASSFLPLRIGIALERRDAKRELVSIRASLLASYLSDRVARATAEAAMSSR